MNALLSLPRLSLPSPRAIGMALSLACLVSLSPEAGAQTTAEVAAGEGFTVALKPDGSVWTWGDNSHGQLGNSTNTGSQTAQAINSFGNVVQVSATGGHVLALKSDNTVWAWGANSAGQLGNSNTLDQNSPQQVPLPAGTVVAVSAGEATSFVVMDDGTVYGWGSNVLGQLGDGTVNNQLAPEQISSLDSVVALAAGPNNTVAVEDDGSVWVSGSNASQQLGSDPGNGLAFAQVSGIDSVTAVAVGDGHVIALKTDGTVWGWGSDVHGSLGDGQFNVTTSTPQQIGGFNNATGVFAAAGSTFILFNDGSIQAVGQNDKGQLGLNFIGDQNQLQGPPNLPGLSGFAVSRTHSIALTQAGSLIGWGDNSAYELGPAFGVHCATAAQGNEDLYLFAYETLACGADFQLHTDSDAYCVSTGRNQFGQQGQGNNADSSTNQIIWALAAYYTGTVYAGAHVAFTTDGSTLWAWGNNSDGQLGDGTTTNQNLPEAITFATPGIASGVSYTGGDVAGGDRHSLAVMSDGSVAAWGNNDHGELGDGTTNGETTPESVPNLGGIVQVAGGGDRSFALDNNGNVWAWGENANGELGLGTTGDISVPTQIPNLPPMKAIAASPTFTMALDMAGNIWTWGRNNHGQLGNGTMQDNETPTEIQGLQPMIAISAGGAHAVALQNNKSLWTWGANGAGQLGNGTFTDNPTPIVVPHISDVTAAAAGGDFTSLIRHDGSVEGFGNTSGGQLGASLGLFSYTPVPVVGFAMNEAAPQISLSQPTMGTVVAGGQVVTLQANASADGAGSITKVDYFVDGVEIGEATQGGTFDQSWTLPPSTAYGDYALTAVAYNSDGVAQLSKPLSVYLSDDQNGNGLPDWWEMQYFGNLNQTADGDYDGDGISNLQEYLDGTDPTDYYNGASPNLLVLSGDEQQGTPGSFEPNPIIIQVTDDMGQPIIDAPVILSTNPDGGQLSATNGDGYFLTSTLTVMTDSSGFATFYYYLAPGTFSAGVIQVKAGGTFFSIDETTANAEPLAASYSASQGVTADPSNGLVSQVLDQGGEGHTLIQATAANQPILSTDPNTGQPAWRFNGNQALLCPDLLGTDPDITIITVASADNVQNFTDMVTMGISPNYEGNRVLAFQSGQLRFDTFYNGANAGTAPAAGQTTITSVTYTRADSTVKFFTNGQANGVTNASTTDVAGGVIVGQGPNGSQSWSGAVDAVVIYRQALSDTQRLQIEGQLADQYGIYHPSATWPQAYSQAVQQLIASNQWNKSQANAYVAFLATNPPVAPSNIVFWLKADTGLTTDGSGNVQQWKDQGPSGHVLGSAGTVALPVKQTDAQGNPTIHFSGTQALSSPDSLPANGDVTIVAVSSADNPNGGYPQNLGIAFSAGDQNTDASARSYGYYSGHMLFSDNSSFIIGGNSSGPTEEAVNTITFERDTGAVNFYLRGSNAGPGPQPDTVNDLSPGMVVGNNAALNEGLTGTVSEILVFNRILTDSERAQAEGYLADKYKIYDINATWPTAYTPPVQALIAANHWNKAMADHYTAFLASNPPIPTTGIGLWLKADTGVTADASNNVSSWIDQVTQLPFSQATLSYMPTRLAGASNGIPALHFTKSNPAQFLANPGLFMDASAGITLVSVFRSTASDDEPGYSVCLGTGSTNAGTTGAFRALGTVSGNEAFDTLGYGVNESVGTAVPANTFSIQAATLDATQTNVAFYSNGTQTATGTVSNVIPVGYGALIGAESYYTGWRGDICEVLAYNHPLTASDMQQVNYYLADKYGIYIPNAPWILGYTPREQAAIVANQWSKAQADAAVSFYAALPSQVPDNGCVEWLRADQGITADGSGKVATWADQSLNQYNFSHYQASAAPTVVPNALNGLPGISFDGAQNYLYGVGNSGMTIQNAPNYSYGDQDRSIIFLVRYDGNGPGGFGYGYNGFGFIMGISPTGQMEVSDGATPHDFGQNINGSGYLIEEAVLHNSAVTAYINGDQVGSFTQTFNTQPYAAYLASNLTLDGFVKQTSSELFVYNRALSDSERQAIESYLETKYNLHPNVAPIVFNPPGGISTTGPHVALSTITPGATIVYTTDGSTPTHTSTVYSGPIGITQTTTINALAFASGRQDSAVATQTYTVDNQGPALTNLQFSGSPLANGATLSGNGSFTVNAAIPAGLTGVTVSHVDFLIDGALLATSTGPNLYSANFNIAGVPDGPHTLTVNGYDTLANVSTQTVSLTVQEAPPPAPTLTSPANGLLSGTTPITVQGKAVPGTTITLYNNSQPTGATVLAGTDGTFQASVSLVTGANSIQATATNPGGRGGEGPQSGALSITLNTNVPGAPGSFVATTLAGGYIQLSWASAPPGTVSGYNIYRSTTPFMNGITGSPINSSPITGTQFTDLPASDGTYYYLVVAVGVNGLDSIVSQQSNTNSDRTAPEATSIAYSPLGEHDATTGEIAPGIVNVTVTMSEPIQSAPFLSVTPAGGFPIAIQLQASPNSNLQYTGSFAVQSTTPTGQATAVLAAVDLAGNRGTKIDSGGTLLLDTAGPAVTALMVSPSTVIQNSSSNPVQVQVTLTLSKPAKDGTTPVVGYTLSSTPGNALTFSSVTAGSNNTTWVATTTLPATAGATPENMTLTFSSVDHLDNVGTTIGVPDQFQVYQGQLPGLAAPFGLAATPQPAGKVQLNWQSVAGAADYQLYREGPGGGSLQPLALTGGATSYLDSTSSDGTYTYTVATVRSLNSQTTTGMQSGPVSVLAQSQPPGSPQTLTASLAGYGVVLQWASPASLSEQITYSIYRSSGTITSLSGLTPLATGLTAITAVDPHPDPTQPNYAVAAVDQAGNISAPSNSIYLNDQLLPVSSLTIIQADSNPPVVSWSAVSGNIAGYNIYLGPSTSMQQLNTSGLLTTTSYTDTGYTSNERQYTVVTVDTNNESSVGHSLLLPLLTATPAPDAAIEKGLINDLVYTVTNSSAETVSNVDLRVTLNNNANEQQVSPAFSLQPGQSQQVTVVVGGYSDLPQGSTPLTTAIEVAPHAGELVSIQRSGSVAVTSGALTASVLPSSFTRGGNGTVQFSVTNPSPEPIEILVAKSDGTAPSSQVRINLVDANNTVYSTTPVQFNLGANVITLSNGDTVLQVPANSTVTSPVQVVAVPDSTPDSIYVQLQIDQVYFDEGQPDQVALQGLTTRQAMSVVNASYSATVTNVSPPVSNGNQAIVLSGTATNAADGTPAANQAVVLHVDNNGFDLTYQLATDATGAFTYTFTPSPGQVGGVYTTWAVNPAVTDRSVQQTFTIQQISISPSTINVTAPKNYPQTLNFKASAGPGTSATNLHFTYVAADQPGGQFPGGITVDASQAVASLSQNTSATLPVVITGDSTVSANGSIVLRLRSDNDQGQPWQTVQVNYTFADDAPALRWSSYSNTAGVNPGSTAATNLTLTNAGLAAASNVTIQVLNAADGTLAPSWVSLGNANTITQVNVGDNIPIAVNFSPPSSLSQGIYNFIVRASAPNQSNQDSVVAVTVTASGMGNALFHATDIYTGTTDGSGNVIQGLAGASITLTNVLIPTDTVTLTSDATGEASFQNLTVGQYQYHATASGHDSSDGTIWIQPGTTATQQVPLQNDLVSVNWTVVPTTIQDVYNVTINATFQTQVPAPVITATPSVVNLPPMQAGDVYNGQITFTNSGLISANNVTFSLPGDDAYLHYQMQGTMPASLGAGQSVTLAYKITCLQSFPLPAVTVAMVGGGGASLAASIGLFALGWGTGRRRLRNMGWSCLLLGTGILTLAGTTRAWAQSTSNCFSYQTGGPFDADYICAAGNTFHIHFGVNWYYLINNCQSSNINVGGTINYNGTPSAPSGGASYSPAPSASGGVDCFPWCPNKQCKQQQQGNSWINLSQREYRDAATDLSIKIPGGVASITRQFYQNSWHWHDLTDSLTLVAGPGGIAEIDYDVDHFPVVDSAFTTYVETTNYTKIVASATGYRLQTKDGQWKTFDLSGKLLATGYRNLTLTKLQYDGSGNLTAVDDCKGNTVFVVTSANGQISAIQDAAGRSANYGYTGSNLTSVKDALGQTTAYTYDGGGHLTSKTDVNGNTFTIAYSGGGYVTSEVDSKGNGWFYTFSYDPNLQQYDAQVTTSAGKVEERTFASDGTLILDSVNGAQQQKVLRSGSTWSITEANGATVQQTWDQFNNLLKEVRPEGATSYQYEPQYNQPTQITNPDGTITQTSYDGNGNLLSKTEAAGTSSARTTTYSYDSYNQLTEKTDPRGNKVDYSYDGKGDLLREYDPANPSMQITYTYDAAGNRLSRTDPLGNTTHYAYDALGRVTTETDALGNQTVTTYSGTFVGQEEVGRTPSAPGRVTKYSYDQDGRRTQVIRVGNGGQQVQQSTAYDADGNVVAQTNALGQTASYQYDQSGRQSSSTLPSSAGSATSAKTYNNDGTISRETDSVGTVTNYTYDNSGRLLSRTEAAGSGQQRTISYAYDPMSRATQIAYTEGTNTFTTNYVYDALGRKTSVSGQREYPKTDKYDANDNLVEETDARGNVASFEYDAYNRCTQASASGRVTIYAYDLDGDLISTTDGNGVSRGYAFDALNRSIAQSIPVKGLNAGWASSPTDVLSSATYDSFGEVIATQDIAGGGTGATFDDFGRVLSRTETSGLTLSYSYNALDQITSINYPPINASGPGTAIRYVYDPADGQTIDSITDRAGNTTSFQYDSRHLKTQETDSNGAVTQFVYDPLGRLAVQTDTLGETTLYGYDQFNQLTQVVYPDSTTQNGRQSSYVYDAWGKLLTQSGTGEYPITYGYDASGNQTSITDGNNSQTQWTYDGLNRITGKIYADGSTYRYGYDSAGNLASRTDALGRMTQYQYNAYNLVSQIAYPDDAPVGFQYDAAGRRTSMTDASGTTTWGWDSADRIISYSQGVTGQSVTYGYDAENHRTNMNVGTWVTQYGFDAAGRPSTILDQRVSASSPFTYAYQPGTNWIAGRTNADGSATINQYDLLGRVSRVTAAGSGGVAVNTYAYAYDAAGQRTQEASTVGTRDFGYDNMRQMTTAYRSDGSGNPLPSYNYSYNYDAIGNITQSASGAGQINFTPNHLNEIASITGSGLSTTDSPQYDADGNMTSDGKGNSYVYDEENRLTEVETPNNPSVVKIVNVYDGIGRRVEARTYGPSGSLISTVRYLYDGGSIIGDYDGSNAIQHSYTRGPDGLLALATAQGAYSYFCDGSGNVVDVTDAYGNSAAHYEYDPFGNVLATAGTLQQPFQWSSQPVDGNGLVCYLYRFYNPSLGRWQNRDPIQEQGGANLYSFADNSPINADDPFGLAVRRAAPVQVVQTQMTDIPKIAKDNGLTHIGNYLQRWFSNPIYAFKDKTDANESEKQPFDNSGMTMAWIVGVPRGGRDYSAILATMHSAAAQLQMKRVIKPYVNKRAQTFGDDWLNSPMTIHTDKNYSVQYYSSYFTFQGGLNSNTLKTIWNDATGPINDFDATLGNYNMKALVGGKICYDDDGVNATVTVDKVGIYARVAIAFPTSETGQALGYWDKTYDKVTYWGPYTSGSIYADDEAFNKWRGISDTSGGDVTQEQVPGAAGAGRGQDFWAFSDVKVSPLAPNIIYRDTVDKR